MKEATGELNMTVIVVLAVAALAAFFYTILWPLMKENFNANAQCAQAICYCKDKKECKSTGGLATCHKKGSKEEFSCPWKG